MRTVAMDPRRAHLDPRLTATPPQPPPPPPPASSQQPQPSTPTNGVVNGNSIEPTHGNESVYKLKFCTVCASNQNRSMEAHLRLAGASYPCISFGTGSLVRLPGPSITQPNVYPFNTTSYQSMYNELSQKDPRLYRANGLLTMLERNLWVKRAPERWQDWPIGAPRLDNVAKGEKGAQGVEGGVVDIVITCEERCWDAVVDDLINRGGVLNRPVHVINVDIKDNHEEALVGGRAILDLADSLNEVAKQEKVLEGQRGTFDERVPEVLADWQERWPQLPALWTLCWF
ncbi:MAG: hypothetical protein Q9163_005864 [Psora crenata]